MNCDFSVPVDIGTATTADFEYSKVICDTGDIYELIQNQNYPDREFFVEKTINYGDSIIIWFLTLFTIYFISNMIFKFFWRK